MACDQVFAIADPWTRVSAVVPVAGSRRKDVKDLTPHSRRVRRLLDTVIDTVGFFWCYESCLTREKAAERQMLFGVRTTTTSVTRD